MWMATSWKSMFDAGITEGKGYSEETIPDLLSFDAPGTKLQRLYLDRQYKKQRLALMAGCDDRSKTRLKALLAKNSNVTFNTLPSTPEMSLRSGAFQINLCARVGLSPPNAYHPRIQVCHRCQTLVNVNTVIPHVEKCVHHSGTRTRCHDHVKAAFQAFFNSAGYSVGVEATLWKGNNRFAAGVGEVQGYRVDLVTHSSITDTFTAYDVSMANPYSANVFGPYLNPRSNPGDAAKRRAAKKVRKYAAPCTAIGYEFSPLCFENTLGWDTSVVAVVRRVMVDIHRLRGDHLLGGIRYWTRRLSFALARAVAMKTSTSLRYLVSGEDPDQAHIPINQYGLFPPLLA
jgi:hypothetical protein